MNPGTQSFKNLFASDAFAGASRIVENSTEDVACLRIGGVYTPTRICSAETLSESVENDRLQGRHYFIDPCLDHILNRKLIKLRSTRHNDPSHDCWQKEIVLNLLLRPNVQVDMLLVRFRMPLLDFCRSMVVRIK